MVEVFSAVASSLILLVLATGYNTIFPKKEGSDRRVATLNTVDNYQKITNSGDNNYVTNIFKIKNGATVYYNFLQGAQFSYQQPQDSFKGGTSTTRDSVKQNPPGIGIRGPKKPRAKWVSARRGDKTIEDAANSLNPISKAADDKKREPVVDLVAARQRRISDSINAAIRRKKIDSIYQRRHEELLAKINFRAPRLPRIDTTDLTLSEYPGGDTPEIGIASIDNVKGYELNMGGFWLWTDCKDCNWEVSFFGQKSQNIIVSDKMPKRMPPNTFYQKFKSDTEFKLCINNKDAFEYDDGLCWTLSIKPRQILIIRISKKSRILKLYR